MEDPPLTEQEVQDWVTRLGPTNEERLEVIRHLLKHRRGDGMSPEDAHVCQTEEARLKALRPKAKITWQYKSR